jgi:hypothetical protein
MIRVMRTPTASLLGSMVHPGARRARISGARIIPRRTTGIRMADRRRKTPA